MTDRWDALFADVAGRLAAERRAELEDEVAERVRIERARISLMDRLDAHRGRTLALETVGGGVVQGEVREVGEDWLRLSTRGGDRLVGRWAVAGVAGLTARARPAGESVARRVTWVSVLRELSRDRSSVRVAGSQGGLVEGRVDRVLADHLDLAVGPTAREARSVRVIPFEAVAWVGGPGA
ncbi:hypothetical protein SAMN05445756_1514 [Kytococcus aerolatus]|uniref:Fis family transcriptional regulator n=1 Tax=Kytococcus aerolatus TaxID=592308 RepID=A0A212U045_9MICO|nr:hypothetical protein [Kytococcus aerolatus]SNC71504.1 hypothetical protein SAMN05445756_1514 [Kytococcus aerolatus]